MPDFPIVDTHVHLYDPKAVAYPWMARFPKLNARHSSDEFSAATAPVEVDKLVFVEVDAGPGQHMAEVGWVEALAQSDRRIAGIVAAMPLEQGAAVEPDIATFARLPLARGVRRLIQDHVDEPGWCLRREFVEGVKLVGKHGLGFEICIYHPQLDDAIELVRRCPEVSFVLDHIGKPGIRDGLMEPWKTGIRTMSGFRNVVCKLSGVITEADHASWSYDQIAPYMSHVLDCFGFGRTMYGGDWPVLSLAARYPDWVAAVDRVTAGASPGDLRRLYRENAIAHYRL